MRKVILILVLLIFFLFGVAFFYLGAKTWRQKKTLNLDEITTTEYVHNGLPYILNYAQHQAVINLINSAKRIPKQGGFRMDEELRFYSDPKNPVVFYPLNSDYSLFSIRTVNEYDLLIEDHIKLKDILTKAYDS